jgi:hypothetical protein
MTLPKSRIGRIVSFTRVFLAAWQNVVICVDQRINSSKSNIIDVYREKIRPMNLTLWHPHRDCQSGESMVGFKMFGDLLINLAFEDLRKAG